jgi:hypothetical protein
MQKKEAVTTPPLFLYLFLNIFPPFQIRHLFCAKASILKSWIRNKYLWSHFLSTSVSRGFAMGV